MHRIVRWALVAAGAGALALAAGFFFQMGWATNLWPWPTSRLSNIFIASILAASAVPVLWIGISGELAAIAAGAINLFVANAGMAAFAFQVYAESPARRPILIYAIVCTVSALACAGLAAWSRRIPFRESEPSPRAVRLSFIAFSVILILVGGALVLRLGNMFPWKLGPEQSVLYGWIFLGAACYFLHALKVPAWGNARGQLMGFLAYDLVLIGPFVAHFAAVDPALRVNLIVYVTVLVYSGALAVYYLFLARKAQRDAGYASASARTIRAAGSKAEQERVIAPPT
jgi:hypothetical protein